MTSFLTSTLSALLLVSLFNLEYLTRHAHQFLFAYLLGSTIALLLAAVLIFRKRASNLAGAVLLVPVCAFALAVGYLVSIAWVKGLVSAVEPLVIALSFSTSIGMLLGWQVIAIAFAIYAGLFLVQRYSRSNSSS